MEHEFERIFIDFYLRPLAHFNWCKSLLFYDFLPNGRRSARDINGGEERRKKPATTASSPMQPMDYRLRKDCDRYLLILISIENRLIVVISIIMIMFVLIWFSYVLSRCLRIRICRFAQTHTHMCHVCAFAVRSSVDKQIAGGDVKPAYAETNHPLIYLSFQRLWYFHIFSLSVRISDSVNPQLDGISLRLPPPPSSSSIYLFSSLCGMHCPTTAASRFSIVFMDYEHDLWFCSEYEIE